MTKSFLSEIRSFDRFKLSEVDKNINGEVIKVSKYKPGAGLTDDDDKTEYIDTEEEVNQKVKKIAQLIRNSKHMVAYTGAGISTSTGIPDYRGGNGVWTLLEKGEKPKSVNLNTVSCSLGHKVLTSLATVAKPFAPALENVNQINNDNNVDDEGYFTDYQYYLGHEKNNNVNNNNINDPPLRYVVTTNLDGLHIKSGLPMDKIAELHGNSFKVRCKTCSKYYLKEDINYSRRCPSCKGELQGTGVPFGYELPADQFEAALNHSKQSDLALVLGTSMKVSPACNLPEWSYRNKGHLIICNYQKTPYDKYASVVAHCSTDLFLGKLYHELYQVDFA